MKKMLQIIAIIGLISVNISYASEKQIQVPVQKTDWLTRLKQWFTPKPGPKYTKLKIMKKSVSPYEVGTIVLPSDLQTGKNYRLIKIANKVYIKKEPTSSEKIQELEKGFRRKEELATIMPLKIKPTEVGYREKTFVTPGSTEQTYRSVIIDPSPHRFKTIKPAPQLYPKKTEKLFKKYGAGWE